MIRFWDLDDMPKKPLETMKCKHGKGESLTAMKATSDGKYLVTSDTGGRIKCMDMRFVDFKKDASPKENIRDVWFIHAHKAIINSLQLCEAFPESDIFVISASSDCNILVHRMSSGVLIG
jgi:WD40 repeat protein